MAKKYANVIQKPGGPFSLYCTSCKRWVPNTANAEMKKEGIFAHSHFCVDGVPLDNDGSIADRMEEGENNGGINGTYDLRISQRLL